MAKKHHDAAVKDSYPAVPLTTEINYYAAAAFAAVVLLLLNWCFGLGSRRKKRLYPDLSGSKYEDNSLLNAYNAKHVNAIIDQFTSLQEVTEAVRKAGLESSNLIFGVDFTASNLHQGCRTFGGQSLHAMVPRIENPYQQVIRILGRVLTPFDEDGIIPAFGFGDLSTKDRSVFPFRAEGYCHGFEDVLQAYNRITPTVKLSGPTNFAPVIYQAIDIVKSTKSYHILVIVADGQVTSEKGTRDAIVAASHWPLSIIVVGVGDGPWDMMQDFDDRLPTRKFDNFQFVDYNKVLSYSAGNPDPTFALHALMEIPDQYKTIRSLGLLDF